MPSEKNPRVNVGQERKRKRIEEKIGKAGRKQPRRCDKENEQLSRFFTNTNHPSTSDKPKISQIPPSSTSATNYLTTPLSLRNISNVVSPSIVIDSVPRAIRSIRLMSPTNLSIVPSQQNPVILFPTTVKPTKSFSMKSAYDS